MDEEGSPAASMRAATLSGFGQGAGPVLSVKFEPPEFDPPQAVESRVSASTMNEERGPIPAILGVHDTLLGHVAEESAGDPESVPVQEMPADFERVQEAITPTVAWRVTLLEDGPLGSCCVHLRSRLLPMMRAARLRPPGGIDALSVDEIEVPQPGSGEALVRVHATAITRDELDWPTDRLPAIVSYELSGVLEEVTGDAGGLAIGDEVFALTPFDRDGVAAEHAVVPAAFLAPKPVGLSHIESAALPLAGLTAWQGLFVHGELQPTQRILILGAAGGVGHLATQLATWRGAHVIGTASEAAAEFARGFGAEQVLDPASPFVGSIEPVDLVFDTVGGDALARSADVLRGGGRLVAVAEEPSPDIAARVHATYFVVEPEREQLVELSKLASDGVLRPAVDSVFPLEDARAAFDRVMSSGKRGKVVIEVDHA